MIAERSWTERGAGVESTFITYKELGPFSDPGFRGSTNSLMINDLLDTYEPALVLDPMAGSYTVEKVCRAKGISVVSWDISKGQDLTSPITRRQLANTLTDAPDFIFWDPPYFNMVDYGDGNPNDLSRVGIYSTYLKRMTEIFTWLGSLLAPLGVLAFECGDLRRPGITYFITDDLLTPQNCAAARVRKELRICHGFPLAIRNEEGYAAYLRACKARPHELAVEIQHEYITILRSTH